MEGSAAIGLQRAKQRDSCKEDRGQSVLTRRDRWGLGAEARDLEVRSQGEDRGWLRGHSQKGLVRHS